MTNNHFITGVNVLTVMISNPSENDKLKRKAFFCPYTKNITFTYQGNVDSIQPGYDPDDTPQIFVYPQRMTYGMNINYTFKESKKNSDSIDFWIQDQYFNEVDVKTYHCSNCQAPSLYFSDNKAVHFNSKNDLKRGERFKCRNPYCNVDYTFQGLVKITRVV